MGQQIPFETLDSLAAGILDVLPNPAQIKPRLRTVKIADQVLQRVEFDIDGMNEQAPGKPVKKYELHLYETYWAPKTEGVAKLTDVVSFLWDGGLRGLLNSVKSFKRAMFGRDGQVLYPLAYAAVADSDSADFGGADGDQRCDIGCWRSANGTSSAGIFEDALAATYRAGELHGCGSIQFRCGVVCRRLGQTARADNARENSGGWFLLDGVNVYHSQHSGNGTLMMAISHVDWISSTVGASGASPVITRICITGANSQDWIAGMRNCVVCFFEKMPYAKLHVFSTLVILLAAILVAVTMTSAAALRSSEQRLHGHWWFMVLSVLGFVLNVVAFIGSVLIVRRYFDGWTFPGWIHFLANPAWVWPFLILFSAKVREIMVQYVGDVAIYVRPNKLDRFDAVRSEIKEAARSVVSALFTSYELKTQPSDANKFQYDKIALVGHSLGSVIAYDTLNRLMLDDWLCDGALRVAECTATMVTFGSPLNKTAFLFTIEGKDTLHIRERLAATVQPLIMSYRKFRKFKWINVYSRNDIVSGLLKFYDLPGYQEPPVPEVAVQNVKDRDAAVPLMAHVAYWKNKTVWTQLLGQIAP
jgi:hypothetical protein